MEQLVPQRSCIYRYVAQHVLFPETYTLGYNVRAICNSGLETIQTIPCRKQRARVPFSLYFNHMLSILYDLLFKRR